jgi:hypothetical protein
LLLLVVLLLVLLLVLLPLPVGTLHATSTAAWSQPAPL